MVIYTSQTSTNRAIWPLIQAAFNTKCFVKYECDKSYRAARQFQPDVFGSLATNIILPLHNVTESLRNGKRLNYPLNKEFEIPVQTGDTITFR